MKHQPIREQQNTCGVNILKPVLQASCLHSFVRNAQAGVALRLEGGSSFARFQASCGLDCLSQLANMTNHEYCFALLYHL